MKKIVTEEHIFCDICGKDMGRTEDQRASEWTYTCSRCGKHFCKSCGLVYQALEADNSFSLCDTCFKECGIKDESL